MIKKEEIALLLNEWYQEIRSQNFVKAKELKQNIDTKIHSMEENQTNAEYYSLLDFRFKMLSAEFYPNQSDVSKNDVKKMELNKAPSDESLAYYYHFFKASHATVKGEFKVAEKHYEIAESLLKNIHDPMEKAEFNFKLSSYYYHVCQPVLVIQYATRARNTFAGQHGYDRKVAACDNVLGLACIKLNEFEQAEVYFMSSLDILQKQNEEELMLRVRHSLGVMYAEQNLSDLAIRYLSEVSQKIPNHFRAIFLEARENFKLGETKLAAFLIEKGLVICNELEQEEYKHHFTILKEMNENVSAEQLEVAISKGISFFKEAGLWQYVQEYAEKLAVKYYKEGNPIKSSEYFYLGHKEREEGFQKGALK
ncbi:tetratricopeptide repeat protein [Bacillus sp. DX4.1]|nr:tetratricopeptide repeat protein [Bacillus sp. DX4.1]MDM5187426.1 tetratricopeptide repeat protein [Bacillus sp. DX4.1]